MANERCLQLGRRKARRRPTSDQKLLGTLPTQWAGLLYCTAIVSHQNAASVLQAHR